ncbi:MAG: glycosyltransferase family 4 protein [Bacteroidales bacterium]|nr:glycosyltransferase family 4 protein [Bacteroidales bacterium]
MKKVVLVSNKLYEYRYQLYKSFHIHFNKIDIDFSVLATSLGGVKLDTDDELLIEELGSNIFNLKQKLDQIEPDLVINFLHPTNKEIWLLYAYCSLNRIPNIYWNHGINLQDPNNLLKNSFYHLLHKLSDAIILYSKNELKYIKLKYHSKTFVANNTINLDLIPKVKKSKDEIKNKLNLNFEKIVLFVGRVQDRKRLLDLIHIFKDNDFSNYGLVIVGPGFSEDYQTLIRDINNIKYLGTIYDPEKVNEIFKMSDIFCIPGTNGLGINQAMYWGLPCLALDVKHSPEITYLKQGVTGFIEPNTDALTKRLLSLLGNDSLLNEFSSNAKKVIREEASVEIMFEGFNKAIQHALLK